MWRHLVVQADPIVQEEGAKEHKSDECYHLNVTVVVSTVDCGATSDYHDDDTKVG